MQLEQDRALRKQLEKLLSGGESHSGFDEAVNDFPAASRGVRICDAPHSAWELVEHLRIAQNDILEFCRNPRHESPDWPRGYWPKSPSPPETSGWENSVKRFQKELREFIGLISDPANDLFQPIPHAPEKQTLLREALVLADHNSYHVGQIFTLRKMVQK